MNINKLIGGSSTPLPADYIGGRQIGTIGDAGSLYDGYTLSWGDDFNSLDILSPTNSRGKWWTTRTYLAGSRGSDTLLGTMYDTDPLMTGHNDSNRGVPVAYDNMRVNQSAITLQARKATVGEQTHMSSVRNELGNMLSGAGAINWYPGTASTDDIILEARISFSTAAGNPAGWHPTFWLQSLNPVIAIDSDEVDWEGNSQQQFLHRTVWTGGSGTVSSVAGGHTDDLQFKIISFVLNTTNVRLYIDGTLFATGAWNANSKSKPQYPMFTNHIYNGTFEGETYSAAAWNADGDGASFLIDFIRVWRRSAKAHYAPLTSVADVNVNYGSSVDIVLPAAVTLWGDGSVTEYLQAVYNEENEPGVTHSSIYTQFPTGVSYNAGTRTLTVNITSGKTGRINFVLCAYKSGSTNEPLRFAVNVGPNVTVSSMLFTNGQSVSYDLYAVCDCGILTTNGTTKAKTISVTGLDGSGLSYNDSTGLLTGTYVDGSYSMGVTVTNSLGQIKNSSISISTSSAYAYTTWTGTGWFDFSDGATLTLSGSQITAVANKRVSGGNLTAAGTAANRVLTASAQNGLSACTITRDVTSPNQPRFAAAVGSALSQTFQGTDKPYTVIAVYKPTDTNTGYICGASDTADATNAQQIAIIRRNSTASSIRKQLLNATSNDVSWGTGQASGTARIVAIKHTGTNVSVWDNSTTAVVNGTLQTVGLFNNELIYYIGVAETNGTDPNYAAVQCSMVFMENLVEPTAKADADIQQAITDLATKWGITLS